MNTRDLSPGDHSFYRTAPNRRSADWTGLCWLLIVALSVFTICLPFMHSIFELSDEGILLHGADRLLQGQRLYIDFFEILPPGGFVIIAGWFGITGISIWSARVLAVLTITGIACFTYLACRQTSKHALSSALVAIGWAIMSQGFWTQISYHWFTTLFSMVAAWAVLKSGDNSQRRHWEPRIAGLAASAAAMVIPTRGVLVMLAGAASFVGSRSQRSKLIAYVLAGALVPICLLTYVIWTGALAAAFEDVILFTARRYASIASVPFGYFTGDQNWPLKYLFPVVALLAVIACARDWRTVVSDGLFRSCVAFGLAGFIGCIPRPDIAHIAFVTPLICPLLTYCADRIVTSWGAKYRRYALAAVVIGVGIPCVAAFSFVAYTALHGELVATPRGRVAFLSSGMRELMGRIADTPSSDPFFFYPFIPMVPFLTAREHVSKYDVLIPGYTSPSQYEEACISALRRATWLVIDRSWTAPNFLRTFPAIRDAEPPETRNFELALQSGFEFVARDGLFELRRRVKAVNETICNGIAE